LIVAAPDADAVTPLRRNVDNLREDVAKLMEDVSRRRGDEPLDAKANLLTYLKGVGSSRGRLCAENAYEGHSLFSI
jgi:hypothetical protein